MRMRFLSGVLVLAGVLCFAGGPERGAGFFSTANDGAALVFYIDVDLAKMDTTIDDPEPGPGVPSIHFTPCRVSLSNTSTRAVQTFTNCRIRYKGNTTFHEKKRQFKLAFGKDEKLCGMRRLNLHAEWKDATLIREKLVYDLFARLGVTAPRAVHVRVYLRDSGRPGTAYAYRGLFTAVEQVDKPFVKRNFAQGGGTLFKGCFGMAGGRWGAANLRFLGDEAQYRGGNNEARRRSPRTYRLKTNKKKYRDNYAALASLSDTINNSRDLARELSALFDVEGFLRWLAANTLVGGWDNYWRNAQNYYLYHDGRRWHWIPWDYDNSLGHNYLVHKGYSLIDDDIHYTAYPDLVLIHRVLAVPAWRTRYHDLLRSGIATDFNPRRFAARVDALARALAPHVRADRHKQYTDKEWRANLGRGIITHSAEDGRWGHKAHHSGIKDYVRRRARAVLRQLERAGQGR